MGFGAILIAGVVLFLVILVAIAVREPVHTKSLEDDFTDEDDSEVLDEDDDYSTVVISQEVPSVFDTFKRD